MSDSFGPARQKWLRALAANLDDRHERQLFRTLRPIDSSDGPHITSQGRTYLQFCSNNYLGLATHPALMDAARAATLHHGTGTGASRLVAGSMAIHHQLEEALARFKHAEAALLFPTGFMANLAVLTAFAGDHDLIVSDKLNHASLLDAAKFSGAAHRTFPHRHYARAAELASRLTPDESRGNPGLCMLVSDSVFSMDGDCADLPALCDAADAAGSLVVIDEAHGTGVLGRRGAGLAELQGVESRIDLTIGTLSKAFGSIGGFVTGPRVVIDTLINTARSFIYTTALPPACAAAALAALHLIETQPERRARVLNLADYIRRELRALGFNCGDSASPIIPVILGDAATALRAADFLMESGLFIPAIRPPTVPPNSARLRISLMATHTDTHVEQLLAAMKTLRASLPVSV